MGFLDELFIGTKGKKGSSFSSRQKDTIGSYMDMLQQMQGGANVMQQPGYQQGNEFLQSMYSDPEFFKRFEAPAMRQFQEEIVPGIANRFAGAGTGGSLQSTGFRNAMLRESQNLAQNLSQQRGQMQMQAAPQLLQYAQQPFNNFMQLGGLATGQGINNQYQAPSPGLFQNAAYGAGQAAGKYAFGG